MDNKKVNIAIIAAAVLVFGGILIYSQSGKKTENKAPLENATSTVSTGDATGTEESSTTVTAPNASVSSGAARTVSGRFAVNPPVPQQDTFNARTAITMISTQVAGIAALQQSDSKLAKEVYEKLVSATTALYRDGANVNAWIDLGEVAEAYGRADLAERSYLKAISITAHTRAWENLGVLYEKRGEYYQAAWAYKNLFLNYPDDAAAEVNYLKNKTAAQGF